MIIILIPWVLTTTTTPIHMIRIIMSVSSVSTPSASFPLEPILISVTPSFVPFLFNLVNGFTNRFRLPCLVSQVLQVVGSLLLVSPSKIESLYGNIRLDTFLLHHISAHKVACSIQSVGAMHTDHLILRHAFYGFVELFYYSFIRHFVTLGEYFAILDSHVFELPALVISAGVGQVDHQPQLGQSF